MSYTNPSGRPSTSEVIQRSQSTPNVGVRPPQQQLQRPRRTKTNIDFLTAPRRAIHTEKHVDPFSLGGFFPSSLRQSDQEPSGWWREDGPEEGAEEFAGEFVIVDSDSSLEGSQGALFGREDQPAEALIKREDKLGVLTGCAHFPFHTRSSSVIIASESSDRGPARLGGRDRRRRGAPAFAIYQ
jgi:hypothetical protein